MKDCACLEAGGKKCCGQPFKPSPWGLFKARALWSLHTKDLSAAL